MKSMVQCPAVKPIVLLAVLLGLPGHSGVRAQDTITLNTAARFQTMSGWECVVFSSQDNPAFPDFREELFDRVINEAGINRLRLEVRSGSENPTDYYAQYQAGQIEYAIWRANRYATVNDNADPSVINPAGFHFTELDQTVEQIVLPLRSRAAAKGEPLYVNLNYVAFTGQITQGGGYHHADAAEYGEFILAAFQHLDQRFGLVPDAVEILLEPDNVSQWNGTTVGRAIVAVESRLTAAGYSPDIIAPSCTNMGNAVSYFDALAAVSGALAALDEVCYHRYGGVSDANLQALAARAQQHGKRTSMLEWWSSGNGIDVLLKDLTMGMNAAWQQGVLGGVGGLDDQMALYKVDVESAGAPLVQINRKTRLLRQIYRFVRRGAVRLGVTSSTGALKPVAFVNPNGTHVIAVRSTAPKVFTVQGLPPGTYGVNYSTDGEFNVNRPDQSVGAGEGLTTSLPAAGVLTVHQLLPVLNAAVSEEGTIEVTLRSLKPRFTGVLESNLALGDATGWQTVQITPPADFGVTWSGPVGVGQTFLRYQQH